MQCITPMIRAHRIGSKKSTILSSKGVATQLQLEPNWFKDRRKTNEVFKNLKSKYGWEYQLIPCGKCTGCRLKYSAEWATLLTLEKEYYPDEECWFLTLTYDDAHITIPDQMKGTYINEKGEETHETYKNDGTWTGTLVEEDMQKFIKRLRKHFPKKEIKYFYCGEYGSSTMRPHYHMIIFGAPFDPNQFYDHHIDKEFHKWHNKSHELDKLWNMSWQTNEETGEIENTSILDMAQVEWSNCAYTARYCMKKVGDTWSKEEWLKIGKIPEFVRMSRTIGDRYYEDHKDEIWKNDNMIMRTVKGNAGSVKPPKKFMRKLEQEDPLKAYEIKRKRKELVEKINISKEQTETYNDLDNLIIKADNLQKKSNMLKREM